MTAASDTFNYLAVLFSVVVGLAATELLQGLRALLVARARVRFYWPALLRAGTLLLALAQTWWATFGLRTHAEWTFAMYGTVLLQLMLLYLVSALALPAIDGDGDGEVDMRAAYYAQARPFYLLFAATVAASVLKDIVLDTRLPQIDNLSFHAVFVAIALAAARWRDDRVHKAVSVAFFGVFVTYVVMLFDRLPD